MKTQKKQAGYIHFSFDEVCEILERHAREVLSRDFEIYDFNACFEIDDIECEGGDITLFVC